MLNEPPHLKNTCYLWFIDYVVVRMGFYLRCGDIWLGEMAEGLEKVLIPLSGFFLFPLFNHSSIHSGCNII